MGLLFDLLSALSDNEKEKSNTEKEMDNLNLEEWQKDLVRKGKYRPENFEEDGDLEEDDYYSEDDK